MRCLWLFSIVICLCLTTSRVIACQTEMDDVQAERSAIFVAGTAGPADLFDAGERRLVLGGGIGAIAGLFALLFAAGRLQAGSSTALDGIENQLKRQTDE
ncbi:MAG: hypothetical protein QNJ97_02910 [Myxococcota bacterium]|nr:hypothetical protein [Myxococcota bacterium]